MQKVVLWTTTLATFCCAARSNNYPLYRYITDGCYNIIIVIALVKVLSQLSQRFPSTWTTKDGKTQEHNNLLVVVWYNNMKDKFWVVKLLILSLNEDNSTALINIQYLWIIYLELSYWSDLVCVLFCIKNQYFTQIISISMNLLSVNSYAKHLGANNTNLQNCSFLSYLHGACILSLPVGV